MFHLVTQTWLMSCLSCSPFSYTIIDYNHGILSLKLPKPKQNNHRLEIKQFFIFDIKPTKIGHVHE